MLTALSEKKHEQNATSLYELKVDTTIWAQDGLGASLLTLSLEATEYCFVHLQGSKVRWIGHVVSATDHCWGVPLQTGSRRSYDKQVEDSSPFQAKVQCKEAS